LSATEATVHPLASRNPRQAVQLLRDAVAAATAASMACSRTQLMDAADGITDAAEILSLAHQLLARATEVRASADQAVLLHLPSYGSVEVDGVGTITRRSSSDRKRWDHDRVRSLVLQRTLDRLGSDGGEIRRPPGIVAQEVADAIADAAGIAYWRVGALKALGLNPDALCDVESGPDRVEFSPIGGQP
jgi:hypothetical protein